MEISFLSRKRDRVNFSRFKFPGSNLIEWIKRSQSRIGRDGNLIATELSWKSAGISAAKTRKFSCMWKVEVCDDEYGSDLRLGDRRC